MKQQLTIAEAKALGYKASGTARIVLGRLKVRDRDGDLLEPGFVKNLGAEVPVSVWNHSLIKDPGSKRAGVGTVWMTDTEFGADVVWDDTPEGKATCKRVLEERPDWSWGFPDPETREPTTEEKSAGIKRVIVSVDVLELSPVDQGAGVAQGTLEACCGSCKSAASCTHKGAPKLEGASCKCARSCGCGGQKKETPKGLEPDQDGLVDPPDTSLLDRLMLRRAGYQGKESDRDRERRLGTALNASALAEGERVYVVDVFSDEGFVVFHRVPLEGPWPDSPQHYRATFEEVDGLFTFGEPEPVDRTTSYEPAPEP